MCHRKAKPVFIAPYDIISNIASRPAYAQLLMPIQQARTDAIDLACKEGGRNPVAWPSKRAWERRANDFEPPNHELLLDDMCKAPPRLCFHKN